MLNQNFELPVIDMITNKLPFKTNNNPYYLNICFSIKAAYLIDNQHLQRLQFEYMLLN